MSKKRKTGVYSPNLTNDPIFGDTSTLPEGLKRIHFHTDFVNTAYNQWIRFQLQFPECEVPKMSPQSMEFVDTFDVPKIMNVTFQIGMVHPKTKNTAADCDFLIGCFERDQLSRDVDKLRSLKTENVKLDKQTQIESIFIVNEPIVYERYSTDHSFSPWQFTLRVSNIPAKGFILLQNYLNLVVAFENIDRDLSMSFNVYVDYHICKTDYESAKIWASDYESLIGDAFKYRGVVDSKSSFLTSRGNVSVDTNADPEKFDEVKGLNLFKFSPNQEKGMWIPSLPLNVFYTRQGRVKPDDQSVVVVDDS